MNEIKNIKDFRATRREVEIEKFCEDMNMPRDTDAPTVMAYLEGYFIEKHGEENYVVNYNNISYHSESLGEVELHFWHNFVKKELGVEDKQTNITAGGPVKGTFTGFYIQPCIEENNGVNACDEKEVEFYGVYAQMKSGGVQSIFDCETKEEAENLVTLLTSLIRNSDLDSGD